MSPFIAIFLALITFWAGIATLGWPFVVGVVWVGALIAWLWHYAFGEIEP